MRKRFFSGTLLATMLMSFISCNPKKAEPAKAVVIDKEQIKKEIQAIENKFANVYTHRNVDSITYYADDAVSYFVGQEPVVGKAAIHKFIVDEIQDFPEGGKIINETLEVFVTDDGNNVAEIGSYKRLDKDGNIMQNGHFFSFFTKRNGQYVCTRDMATAHGPEQ